MTDRHLTPEQRTEINQNKGKIRPMEIAKLIGKPPWEDDDDGEIILQAASLADLMSQLSPFADTATLKALLK